VSCCIQLIKFEQEHKSILGSHDIVVDMEGSDCPISIEVDGPFHYAANR
jgi:hypothetical protein